jgi:hypothetical protein
VGLGSRRARQAGEQDIRTLSNVDTSSDSLTAAVDHLDSLRDRVLASEVTFTFAADGLSWGEYLRLQAEHPTRGQRARPDPRVQRGIVLPGADPEDLCHGLRS